MSLLLPRRVQRDAGGRAHHGKRTASGDGVLAPGIAVVGPSCVGKDSVMEALCVRCPDFETARRVITRPTEADGEMFMGVTQRKFVQMQAAGAFVLNLQVHRLAYGILFAINDQRRQALGVLVNLSHAGLKQAQDRFGGLIVISLTASRAVLAERLRARGRETSNDQLNRLDRAALELPEGLKVVYEIDNCGSLEYTVQCIFDILQPASG